jgi:DNA (cytosine-5)-methyltransferase 1
MEQLGLSAGELDLLAGCPPCQGFSSLRTLNGARQVDHPLNDLVFQMARFARILKPRAVMIENVPGLLADKRFDRLCARLKRLGYNFIADIFNAADFGTPQRRRRMILIALRGGEPQFAEPASEKLSVRDVIGDLIIPALSDDPLHNYKIDRTTRVMNLQR